MAANPSLAERSKTGADDRRDPSLDAWTPGAAPADVDLAYTLEAELPGGDPIAWDDAPAPAGGSFMRPRPAVWRPTGDDSAWAADAEAADAVDLDDDIIGDRWIPNDDEMAAADGDILLADDGDPVDWQDDAVYDDPEAFGPAPRRWLRSDPDAPPVHRQVSRGLLAGVALVGVAAIGAAALFATGPGADVAAEPRPIQVAQLTPEPARPVTADAAPVTADAGSMTVSEHLPSRPRQVRTVLVGGPIIDEPQDTLSAGALPSPSVLDNRPIAGVPAAPEAAAATTPLAADGKPPEAPPGMPAAEPAAAGLPPLEPADPVVAEASPAPEAPPSRTAAAPLAASAGATVTTHVNMRASADNKAAVVRVVPSGAQVEVISCEIWCEVRYEGKTGWIFRDFIRNSAI